MLQGTVSAVVVANDNPFPTDLQDETPTGLVATHDARPGVRLIDGVEFEAAAGNSTVSAYELWRGSRATGWTGSTSTPAFSAHALTG